MSVIRASGKQTSGAIITGIAYFALGIPISYVCAFNKGMSIRGLWVGPTVAVAFNSVMYNIIISCMNWKELITGIKER